jgi:hypothetical protein
MIQVGMPLSSRVIVSLLKNENPSICRIRMQLIVRSLTTHVLDVSPDANVEVAMLVFIFYSS